MSAWRLCTSESLEPGNAPTNMAECMASPSETAETARCPGSQAEERGGGVSSYIAEDATIERMGHSQRWVA